jgi:hypothetical protein
MPWPIGGFQKLTGCLEKLMVEREVPALDLEAPVAESEAPTIESEAPMVECEVTVVKCEVPMVESNGRTNTDVWTTTKLYNSSQSLDNNRLLDRS